MKVSRFFFDCRPDAVIIPFPASRGADAALRKELKSARHIGDFHKGDVYHHGAVQITPFRNRQYINKFGDCLVPANTELSSSFGFSDPDSADRRAAFGEDAGLVSQGFVFNTGFGLSVHDISFNAVANLSYSRLVFGVPVFEGDILSAVSKVLGVEFRKDGATNGSVQVETTVKNSRGETALSYVRRVLVRGGKGASYEKSDTTEPMPENVQITPRIAGKVLPKRKISPVSGVKTFESFKEGDTFAGSVEKGLALADFSWLQIATLNDASVHHTPSSNFIGYGGAVKAFCEGAVSGSFPIAFHLAMNSGSHDAPTYPSDIVREIYAGGKDGEHEQIRARARILSKSAIEGRDDYGVLTVRLTGEKRVTDAGMKALERAKFSGMDGIAEEGGKKWLRVLTLEQVAGVPTGKAFG